MFSIFLRNGAAAILKNNLAYSLKYYRKPFNATQIRYLILTPRLEKLVTFKLSDIGEGIREVTVKEWFVKVGDSVEQFDNLCEVQSDKASVTITSRYDGQIVKLHHPVDDIAFVGQPLLDFEVEEDDDESSDSESSSDSISRANNQSSSQAAAGKVASDEDVARHIALATPAVRRVAMENKVDLSKVSGTGKQGRVLKGDVLEYLGHLPAGTNIPHPTIAATSEVLKTLEINAASKSIPSAVNRIESLKGVPKAMLNSMSESLKIPHFAYSDEIDMTKLIDIRDQLKIVASELGISKLTFMPFCIKAASIALSKYPILNSSLDVDKQAVIYKASHNISVAIDTPQGLVVPNIKNCESKNILEIAKDLEDLIERGRKNALSPKNFADGTFSLSNIGVVGGTYTHPCIMAPQVAIGAMGRTKAINYCLKETSSSYLVLKALVGSRRDQTTSPVTFPIAKFRKNSN